MKILISWYAYKYDFVRTGEGNNMKRERKIAEDSPTWNVHKYFWEKYDKHILLTANIAEKDTKYYDFLFSELTKGFKNHKIEAKQIPIEDIIDIKEICNKIQKFLSQFTADKVDILVNTGTPQMHAAWYLVAPNFRNNITLFQLRHARHTTSKEKPEKLIIELNDSFLPTNLNISSAIQENLLKGEAEIITPSIQNIYEKAKAIANTDDVTCLLLGESGTGKEYLAKHIHNNSSRAKFPFKAINCAAFSDELLASELFGHKKGSFTDAVADKIGILKAADGGTVLLDEIGDITKKMQVSLLRVLEQKEIQPIGYNDIQKINVRIIAATNRNLIELSRKGEFRWDLYFRLEVTELKLPPLRERGKREIKILINHFIDKHFKFFPNWKHKMKITREAEKQILKYNFPGNIRELENLVIKLYTFCSSEVTTKDLPEKIFVPFSNESLKLEEIEKAHILRVYKICNENILQTADALDINKNTLKSRLDEYGLR